MADAGAMIIGSRTNGGDNKTPLLTKVVQDISRRSWGASGMFALDDNGDLYRASYDVYEVREKEGWILLKGDGFPIDTRALHTTHKHRHRKEY